MLIAMTILFLTGGSTGYWILPQDFEKRLEVAIVEEDKRSDIMAQYNSMFDSLRIYHDRVGKITEQIAQLNRNHEAGSNAFNQNIEHLLEERTNIQTYLTDKRFKMISNFSKHQWQLVFAIENDAN